MTLLDATCMALKQETVLLHDPVDPLVVWGLAALGQGFPAQDRMHPAIAIGRQVGDDGLDLRDKGLGWRRRTPDPLAGAVPHLLAEAGTGNPDHVGHGLHREPP